MIPADALLKIAKYSNNILNMRLTCKYWRDSIMFELYNSYPQMIAYDINRGALDYIKLFRYDFKIPQPHLDRVIDTIIETGNTFLLSSLPADVVSEFIEKKNKFNYDIAVLVSIYKYITDEHYFFKRIILVNEKVAVKLFRAAEVHSAYMYKARRMEPVLHCAILNHKFEVAEYLIKIQRYKLLLGTTNEVLMRACAAVDNEVVDFLYKHYSRFTPFGVNVKMLRHLCARGNLRAVKYIIEKFGYDFFNDYYSIDKAAEMGYFELFKYLVEKYPPQNIYIKNNRILKSAIKSRNFKLFIYIWNKWYKKIKLSIAKILRRNAKTYGNYDVHKHIDAHIKNL